MIFITRVNIHETDQEQSNLVIFFFFFDFSRKTKTQSQKDNKIKKNVFDSVKNLFKGRELVINAFKNENFSSKLPIAISQVKEK